MASGRSTVNFGEKVKLEKKFAVALFLTKERMVKFIFCIVILLVATNLSVAFRPNSPIIRRSNVSYFASLKPQITKLIDRQDLSTQETEEAWDIILSGTDPAAVGALLTLLRSKGETPKEIAGMVKAMQNACLPVKVDGKLLDIVGTGGDGADTINISTASVVLAAACGCKVAKAGNRSVSSRCGSADVLEALGVKIELDASQVEETIKQCNIGVDVVFFYFFKEYAYLT